VPLDDLDLNRLAEAIADKLAQRAGDLHRLLDRPELARRLGVSERGVTGLANRGELPPGYLIGGVRRWSWPEVLRFLEARSGRRPRRGRGRRKSPDDRARGGTEEM
jgi:hypothetical protein